jgi:Cysteine-rich secretory protein family
MLTRLATLVLACTLALCGLAHAAPPPVFEANGPGSAPTPCRGADLDPAAGGSMPVAARATLCLLNAERAKRGLAPLHFDHRLELAGRRHALDMIHRRYFAHTAPGGQTFLDRIARTHYLTGMIHWTVGENLAWGKVSHSSPRQIVAAWMRSRKHRANILLPRYRQIGIAIVSGAPFTGTTPAATYDTEFGVVQHP